MALVTDQQETMFSEPEEAVTSLHEERIHNEAAEAEDSASTSFGSLDFSAEQEATAVLAEPAAEPVVVSAQVADTVEAVAEPEPAAAEFIAGEALVAEVAEALAMEAAEAVSAELDAVEAAAPAPVSEQISHATSFETTVEASVPAEPAPVASGPTETASSDAELVSAAPAAASADLNPAESAPAESASAAAESLPILTAADFSALEERVLRAVSLVRREREARIAAEERVLALEGRVAALEVESAEGGQLKEEIEALRAEREQVRLRVERLLGQLDALEF